MNQSLACLVVLGVVAVSTSAASATALTIENRNLSVQYDDAVGTFTVAEMASGEVFLQEGRLDGAAGKAAVEAAADPTFGAGKRIVVTRNDGGTASLELCDGVPFVLIRGVLHNNGNQMSDVSKLVPATCTLNLGKPFGELRTLGTAGLTVLDKNPGSYLFLTLADPATRRGVVAGWLTSKEITNNECGSLITGPVRGTRLYFLHGRVWWNDPDPSYVRASIPLNHARLLTSWVAISGAFNLNSDWIPGLPAERLDIMKRTMPQHGATARPVDYFDSIMPAIWLVTDTRQAVRRDVLGLFNWESKDAAIGCTAAKAGLDPTKTYHAFDFWSNAPVASGRGEFQFTRPAQSCRVVALRAAEGHPVLASTSRHATQGMVDVTDESWNNSTRELAGTSQVVGNDPYELRIAGVNEGGVWRPTSVSISDADKAAGATMATKPAVVGEEGWLRIAISSKKSRAVRWSIKFDDPK